MAGWTDPTFLNEAHEWIASHASVIGEIEQPHVQLWSTVLRVPTADDVLWFKAVPPDGADEIPLTLLLAELHPDRVPEPVATDASRRWMLLRDAGTKLRDVIGDRPELHHWERFLPEYAEIQLSVAPYMQELLAMGVDDERLGMLPLHLSTLLDQPEFLMLDQPDGLSSEDRDRLRAQLPEIAEMCAELATLGIPETVQHDDLHDGNVFIGRDGGYRIMDWGDSCVSHPFHTLTVTLRAVAWKFGVEPGGPEVNRIRDAYLEPFERFGSRARLVAASETAELTGRIGRALAWARYVAAREPEDRDGEDLESVPYGLKLFLDCGPLGPWQ